ncbi:MAG: TlyA family RNA methyltransferase [Clostridia bacterium]|nr:TlyA family RNA methyltransferase [Clostridia bacterium]
MRLDLFMVQSSLARSREQAKELIANGKVEVDGKICEKPSFAVENHKVTVKEQENFVGRGAKKLFKAFSVFSLDVKGKICIDAGASTGGFTEMMLREGAAKVYAVDVGQDQLAESLKADERVINLEKTDIRKLELSEKAAFFTADVSFISLTQIFYHLYRLSTEDAEGVCLVKPQFEAGREFVGKKGVVKDKKAHIRVLSDITEFAKGVGFFVKGLTTSPITGQNGNIEYLLYLGKGGSDGEYSVEKTVADAFGGNL